MPTTPMAAWAAKSATMRMPSVRATMKATKFAHVVSVIDGPLRPSM